MKANKKIMELLNHGFSNSLLSNLNERQIDSLHQRLEESKKENKEQITTSATTVQIVGPKGGTTTIGGKPVTMTPTSAGMAIKAESEMNEDDDTDIALALQSKETNEQESNDGDILLAMNDPEIAVTFGAQDLGEKFESKKQQKYFWYKCGDGKTKEQKKWCKMAKEFSDSTKNFSKLPEKKKKETKEEFGMGDYTKKLSSVLANNLEKAAYNMKPDVKFGESVLEKKISNLVEKHLPPKMSKKDLVNMINEAGKEVETPVKPDVKPERPKPQTPYQPKHKPAPKAGEREVETPVKPDVKPERPKPQTPYQPKHKPAPKAEDVPQWLTFGSIGINLK
jgi:hypothetical protein